MSTIGTGIATLSDWRKTLDPDGSIARVIELLDTRNPITRDMLVMQGNLPTGHRTTVRTGLPTVYWRLMNQGTPPSTDTTAQVDEGCGMMEAWSEVDIKLAQLNGNVNAFRTSKARSFIQAMQKEMASTMFYGNSSLSPAEFNGLSVRYSDKTAENARNMIDGGAVAGQTDCTSIWLVVWGEDGCHGIFPKGSTVGLQHKDLGEQVSETAPGESSTPSGTRMRVFREWFGWDIGMVLADWRQVARVHSIDISANNADYIDMMTKAKNRIEDLNAGTPVFYMNRTIAERLELLRRSDVIAGGGLTWDVVDGKWEASFKGIPIRVSDGITEAEDSLN
jgi:hypothetical protein